MKYFIPTLVAFFSFFISQSTLIAQLNPVQWNAELVEISEGEYSLELTAITEKNWVIYSQHIGEDGPIPTIFEIELVDGVTLDGDFVEPSDPIVKMDEMFGMVLTKFKGPATFKQKILSDNPLEQMIGNITFMTCDETKCLPPTTVEFIASKN